MYWLNYWGSKPGTNDDCWTGFDYETREEALAAYNDPPKCDYAGSDLSNVAWYELDGPDIHLERPNPHHKPVRVSDDDWRCEARMQSAMGFGVQGWNDWEGC